MLDLSKKIALVTGATGAIGSAITEVLHKQGAFVIAVGTRENVLTEIASKFKERIKPIICDLNDADAVNALIPDLEEQLGNSIDILINNAGITADALLMRMDDTSWDRVLELNLKVPFKLMRNCVKSMIKNRYGRIINISSIVGVMGNAGQGNYCASKAGLIGLSKAIAAEVASRNVTVNCIAPGFIESPMVDKIPEKKKEQMVDSIPMKRTGTPIDVANCVAFLASDEAAYITGQTIHVNGGMIMI